MNQDDRLALRGQFCYVGALQKLQKALRSDHAVARDETFAAGYILALHEVIRASLMRYIHTLTCPSFSNLSLS